MLDAAIWVGYAWADEPRNRAAVVVTGDDEQEVRAGAERLAQAFWQDRRNFEFVAPTGTFDECVDRRAGIRRAARSSSATAVTTRRRAARVT